ncbi:MAG: transposase [Candidatus Zixiibacteriota bacterium]
MQSGKDTPSVFLKQTNFTHKYLHYLPFFEFSPKFHKVIRTTNVIERSFAEVRRRLKVMGYFQNTKSCKRIVLSLFFYFNKKWERRSERIIPIAQYFSAGVELNQKIIESKMESVLA